jgi:nitroreductase
MNVIDALKSRHSCRAYRPDPVSKETVLNILEAAIRAPSCANTQPWEIYVAGGEALEKIRRAYLTNREKEIPGNPDLPRPQNWPLALQKRTEQLMAQRSQHIGVAREDSGARQAMLLANYRLFDAPAVIYLCMDRSLTSWSVFDLGLLSQSIMLVAKHYGLDTIPAVMLASYPEVIRAELEIPDTLAIVIGIALGHSDLENAANKFRSSRRPLNEVVHLKGF